MYDLVIIGGGPAGISAAVYAANAEIKTLLLEEKVIGGQVANTAEVTNYLGFAKIDGMELVSNFQAHIQSVNVDVKFEKAVKIDVNENTVFTDSNKYSYKALIIANGVKRRKLNCPGEDEFLGRGVSYCAICDGGFYKNKTACVIGGGNTAVEDAIHLSGICEKVYLVVRKGELKANPGLISRLMKKQNVSVIYNSEVEEILGNIKVEKIKIKNNITGKSEYIPTNGVFIAIGLEPNNSFLPKNIEVDKNGYIITDENCQTNIKNIFCAGDTRNKKIRQIATAISDGAIAETMAENFIN